MGAIAGLIIASLVLWMLFAPGPKPPARCPTCKQLLPPPPKPKKSDVWSIAFLILLIVLLAFASAGK